MCPNTTSRDPRGSCRLSDGWRGHQDVYEDVFTLKFGWSVLPLLETVSTTLDDEDAHANTPEVSDRSGSKACFRRRRGVTQSASTPDPSVWHQLTGISLIVSTRLISITAFYSPFWVTAVRSVMSRRTRSVLFLHHWRHGQSSSFLLTLRSMTPWN